MFDMGGEYTQGKVVVNPRGAVQRKFTFLAWKQSIRASPEVYRLSKKVRKANLPSAEADSE